MENEPQIELSKKERKELRREQRLEEKQKSARLRAVKRIAKIALVVIIIGGSIGAFVRYLATRPPIPEGETLARNGIHWHPELSIYIKGQKQEIPANIGLGIVEAPIHTHDNTGIIHLEFSGLVTNDDIRLGKFFTIWGKQFNASCIFDYCDGPDGKVKMLVNGRENNEFENYPMRDGDKIEIRYE